MRKIIKAKDMWKHLKKILHENKHSRTILLDNKLLNLDCGDVSITKYFQIISLAARFTNVGSKVLDENHVSIKFFLVFGKRVV